MINPLSPMTQGPQSAVEKINAAIRRLEKLSRITGDGLISVRTTDSGVALTLNLNQIIARIPKQGRGAGTARSIWCEIMGEPDDQADFYRIKLITDDWATTWVTDTWYEGPDKPAWVSGTNYSVASGDNNDNKVKYRATENDDYKYYKCIVAIIDNSTTVPPDDATHWQEIQISTVTDNNPNDRWAEWECTVSHLSDTEDNRPGSAGGDDYWDEINPTKAYAKGDPGALSTCIPQFTKGEIRQVEYYTDDEKYYLIDTFIQGGYLVDDVWVVGSLAWLKASGNVAGRAAAVYRSLT